MRVVYAAGPGNVLATFEKWRSGRDDQSEMVPSYSGQFFDWCREHGHRAVVVAAHPPKAGPVEAEGIRVLHRPVAYPHGPTLGYHFGQTWSAFRTVWECLRFRADALVIVSGSCHFFPLAVLRWCGVRVVVSIHNRLCLDAKPPGRLRRVLNALDARFYRKSVTAIVSASAEISRQVRQLAGEPKPIHDYLPLYRREMFDGIPPPTPGRPFRVLFIGRIEDNKGVYDLLAIAERFAKEGRTDIEFDLCGTGTDLASLRDRSTDANVSSRFRLHGHCDRSRVIDLLSQAHVVVVPTTSRFNEGFNQVVAEGILSRRPVVTSAMCPAIEYVRPGVVEVGIDDVRGYGDAILKLADDEAFYREKCEGTSECREPFFDASRSWIVALERSFNAGPNNPD